MHAYDPTQPVIPEKLHVVATEPPAPAPALDLEPLKDRIAERVRADSRERRRLTPEREVAQLVPELNRQQLGELVAAMAEDGRHADVKAVVAGSGRIYLFSERHLIAVEAAELGRIEEAKLAIVERIRSDSSRVTLTAAADLEPLFPSAEPERRAALLEELRADERFRDVQAVTGPRGEIYYHSDRFVSGNYGTIMMRAKANDACWSIAELVRDRARMLPSPTRLDVFHDPVFQVDPEKLEALVEELLSREAYADLKRIVHPRTRAVYLYSDRYLDAGRAVELVEWEEVGAYRNP